MCSSYENINVKKLGAILIHVICCGQRGKSQQLSVLFAAVTRKIAVINLATAYLLWSRPKIASNDKQQIRFFPLVHCSENVKKKKFIIHINFY